jgi:hypothetical protein
MAVKPLTVELHIDELVLDGFARRDRHAIGDAVERELARLIAEGGLAEFAGSPIEIESVNAGSFKAAPETRGPAIGGEVAGAVYRGISSSAKNSADDLGRASRAPSGNAPHRGGKRP